MRVGNRLELPNPVRRQLLHQLQHGFAHARDAPVTFTFLPSRFPRFTANAFGDRFLFHGGCCELSVHDGFRDRVPFGDRQAGVAEQGEESRGRTRSQSSQAMPNQALATECRAVAKSLRPPIEDS